MRKNLLGIIINYLTIIIIQLFQIYFVGQIKKKKFAMIVEIKHFYFSIFIHLIWNLEIY